MHSPDDAKKRFRKEILLQLDSSGLFSSDALQEVEKALTSGRTLDSLAESVTTATSSVAPLVVERSEKFIISDREVAKDYVKSAKHESETEGPTSPNISVEGDVYGQVSGKNIISSSVTIDIGIVRRNVEEVYKELEVQDPGSAKDIKETVDLIKSETDMPKLYGLMQRFIDWARPKIGDASASAFLALSELIRIFPFP